MQYLRFTQIHTKLILLGYCFASIGLNAATRYVTTNSTSQSGGLGYEISQASSGDIIEVQNDITISAQISISKTITINGNGNTVSVNTPGVDDNGVNNLNASTHRIFECSGNSVTITINDLTIKGGNILGGCISNSANKLVLNRVIISNGRSSASSGGGLNNTSNGVIYMNDCQLIRNSARFGGGFLNDGGTMYVDGTTFSENRAEGTGGGGCENKGNGIIYMNNCTFSNNKSIEIGGGINNYIGTLYVLNSTFTGNVTYGVDEGGAIGNRDKCTIINSIFAYNYSMSAGTSGSPTSFRLDDFLYVSRNTAGKSVDCYYSIFHASSNDVSSNSAGNIRYTGNADGSDNDIFAGGIYTKITDGQGSEIGTAKVFQPYLVSNTTKTATLQLGSFPNQTANKGVLTGYTDGAGVPSVGYYNPTTSAWVNIVGTAASTNQVTVDQLDSTRANPPTRGSVETEINTVYMLKVLKATNGSSTGGSLYGDIYESGDQVTLTAIPNSGYKLDYWKNANTGNSVSTANPWTITINKDTTVEPVFVTSTTYDVTYIGNNQTAGAAPAVQTFSPGGSVTIATKGNLYKDEYYFNGWNTSPTGSGTNYSAGNTYSGSSNLTLYAVWVPYIKYYIKSASTSALTNTSNWSGTRDGSGGSPSNFGSDKIFILSNSAGSTNFSTGANWSVDGALQIPLGATLTITANTTTTLSSDLTNEGVIVGAAGSTLTLDGTSMQYMGGTNILANFISENTSGITLLDSTDITESLTLSDGTLYTGGHLTLKSNATKTAIVKELVSGAAVSGNVTLERYIPARRAFRFLSPGVTTTTSIYQNWQENGRNTAGRGTHITGTTDGTNGFDATQTGNKSLYTFDNSNGTWSAVANTNSTTLDAGTPYRLMIRGDRTVSLATNTPTPTNTTLRTTGTLHTGSKALSFSNSGSGNNLFVGNPFHAPVDLSGIVSAGTNINSDIWIWDPTLSTRGAYVSVDVANNTNTNNSSGANKYLQPGQAFFAVSNGANAALTFTESAKGNTFSNTWRTTTPAADFQIRLYHRDSFMVNAPSCDGISAYFSNDYNDGIDNKDVLKYGNLDETLAWLHQDKSFVKELRTLPDAGTELLLNIKQYREKSYTLVIDYNGDIQQSVWLYDAFLNIHNEIVAGSNVYHFDIKDAQSDAPARFKLVFQNPNLSQKALNPSKLWSVGPNPVKNRTLFVTGLNTDADVSFQLCDMQGRVIWNQKTAGYHNQHALNLPNDLAGAAYLFTVGTAQHIEVFTLWVE